ncbi:MAG: DEAD/DEAH box helicase [Thermoplasmatota archaeon]
MDASRWEKLGLSETSLEALAKLGFESPTPSQALALPHLKAGRDITLEAKPGAGKTLAYGLWLAEREGRSLVLVPTRELAQQVALALAPFGRRVLALYGGTAFGHQSRNLGDAEILVATPGRLLEFADKGDWSGASVDAVVVDEADRMLDMGFTADVERILALLPAKRQTALVSATVDAALESLIASRLVAPTRVKLDTRVASVAHFRLNVLKFPDKDPSLVDVLRKENAERALVFVRSRADVERVLRLLRAGGFAVSAIHGERDSVERRHAIDLFKKGASKVLVATDIASRGIDVPQLDLVVNYDLPPDLDTYVHRAGRAGREPHEGGGAGGGAGEDGGRRKVWGKSVTFVLPSEKKERLEIEGRIGMPLEPYRLR